MNLSQRYSGRKLSARERARARKAAQERAAARAYALAVARGEVPAQPEQSNQRGHTKQTGVRGFGVGAAAPTSATGTNPFLAPVQPGNKFSQFGRRLTGPWGGKASNFAVVLGLLGALIFACVGLAVGAPVLGHEGRPLMALAGAAGVGAGVLLALKGWSGSDKRLSLGTLVTSLLVGVFFVVGTVTNPVVIDGRVFLSTSETAKSFKMAQEIREDLLWLAEVDNYLAFNAAQSGARVRDFPVLLTAAQEMSAKYSFLTEAPEKLPAEEFEPLIQQVTSASYWAMRAVESKIETIEANNARSQADLVSHRAVYGEALLTSGQMLREIATVLELPWEQMGPRE